MGEKKIIMQNTILKNILDLKTDIKDLIRLGSKNDGGYVVNKTSLQNCDVLYTYGVSDDFNFEIDFYNMFSDKTVKMFDHTVNYPEKIKDRIFFKKEALEINNNDSINSFINHLTQFNDLNKNIFLKIDVEGYEYDYFLCLNNNLNIMKNITGMVIEFHNLKNVNNYILFNKIINKLKVYFDVTHIHGNNHGPAYVIDDVIYPETLEISFCNKNFTSKFMTTSVSYPIKGLDSPCHPLLKDYQILI